MLTPTQRMPMSVHNREESGERRAPTCRCSISESIFASVCALILVAVPDSYPERKEVLPIAYGFRTQCSTVYHAGYC